MGHRAWFGPALALAVFVLSAAPAHAGWPEDLSALLATDDPPERERLLRAVVEAAPPWAEVVGAIRSRPFAAPAATGLSLRTAACRDGVERPWVLFVPENYDPARPAPLLVALHGAVMREAVDPDPLGTLERSRYDHPYLALAQRLGMLAIFPQGDQHSAWWDEVGMANVLGLIRTVKREFNVDDDRVFMIGYSDGASGGFAFAMTRPTDLAGIVALSGHMGVGSIDGPLDLFAPNMANVPVYAVTSFADSLYPSEVMRATIRMAIGAGADITYREQEGGHDFGYAEAELPLVADFIRNHARNPVRARIAWETAAPEFGRCGWLLIDGVADTPAEPWHADHNCVLKDDRVTIGFQADLEYAGEGVRVTMVVKDSFAEKAGLLAGDVITRLNETPIADMDGLQAWKETAKRGDPLSITLLRDGKSLELRGTLPEVALYNLFKRVRPSGRAEAVAYGNHVDIRTSRVAALRILVHPGLFRLEREIVVTVNGKEVHRGPVEADLAFLLRTYLEHRDRSLLPVAELKVAVP